MGTGSKADTPADAGDVAGDLAQRLRERRLALGMTLKEVADQAGLSVGFISQIERGITAPSLSSLATVARVLNVHVSDFLAQPGGKGPLTRRAERPRYIVGQNSLVYERLSASFPGNRLRTVIMHVPPGYRSETIAHEGEEIFFVLEGGLTVEVGGKRAVLDAGDSLHFASTTAHSLWNHTAAATLILHTGTMDVFGEDTASPPAAGGMAVTRQSRRRPAAINE